MSLRFTDSEKWGDPWFRKLPPWGKILWEFLCDSCDICGVWRVDTELSETLIGMPIPWGEVGSRFEGRIRVLSADKWLLLKYVSFQFRGKFDPAHDFYARGVVAQLGRHGLTLADIILTPSQMRGPVGGLEAPQCKTQHGKGNVEVKTPRERLVATLRGLGLPAQDQAAEEWSGLASKRAKSATVEEALEFVEWVVKRGLKDGVNVQYAKHAAIYADEWASRRRDR